MSRCASTGGRVLPGPARRETDISALAPWWCTPAPPRCRSCKDSEKFVACRLLKGRATKSRLSRPTEPWSHEHPMPRTSASRIAWSSRLQSTSVRRRGLSVLLLLIGLAISDCTCCTLGTACVGEICDPVETHIEEPHCDDWLMCSGGGVGRCWLPCKSDRDCPSDCTCAMRYPEAGAHDLHCMSASSRSPAICD